MVVATTDQRSRDFAVKLQKNLAGNRPQGEMQFTQCSLFERDTRLPPPSAALAFARYPPMSDTSQDRGQLDMLELRELRILSSPPQQQLIGVLVVLMLS